MKFIHLADLHFGKLLGGISLAEDGSQGDWCRQCLAVVDAEKPDAVLIAGDVFDRSQPSGEARSLASRFLTELTRRTAVLMIAGNHDSAENVEYLSELLENQGLYASGVLGAELKHKTFTDEFGRVTVWLAPYFYPTMVGQTLGIDRPDSYTEAARALLAAQPIDWRERNILVAHQTVLFGAEKPEQGGSETSVGGVGQIDADVFDGFDYVALGHIHRAQRMGRADVRYAGAPLCYHFDEAGKEDERNGQPGILIAELGEKGTAPQICFAPVRPLHPLRNVRGGLEEILEKEKTDPRRGEYIRVTLTDEQLQLNARDILEAAYRTKGSRLLEVKRETVRHKETEHDHLSVQEHTLQELFADYYEYQMRRPMPENTAALLERAAALLEESSGTPQAEEAAAQALMEFALTQGEDEA